jgi:diguanylate cyclase (GGDEF)-like protein/PAS domain S-box-containing protein
MPVRRPLILVIEDTLVDQHLLAIALGQEFSVEFASSGLDGIAMAAASRPDLILLDVLMPGVDGFETCRRLRADPLMCAIPIIFVTADRDASNEVKGLALGASDYIHKPIHHAVTRQRIRNLLERESLRKQLETERQRLNALVNTIPDLLFEVDRQGTYLGVWAQREELLVQQKELLLGHTVGEMMPPDAASICMAAIGDADRHGHSYGRRIRLSINDKANWFELSVSKEAETEQGLTRFVVLSRDITEREEAEERIRHLALHDALTGLPNRALLGELAGKDIAVARREKSLLALLFIDLDKFKPINDRWGHGVGDLLLQAVAGRIRQSLRDADTAARIGGDEFVVLVAQIQRADDAMKVAENLRLALREPFLIDGHTLEVSVSIGVALFPEHGSELVELLKHADGAMYVAKESGRDTVARYGDVC